VVDEEKLGGRCVLGSHPWGAGTCGELLAEPPPTTMRTPGRLGPGGGGARPRTYDLEREKNTGR